MAYSSLIFLPQWQESQNYPHSILERETLYRCPDRCGHNAVCINEDLIVWGGYNERSHGSRYCAHDILWAFNLDFNVWVSVKTTGEVPVGRAGASSVLNWPYWYILTGHSTEGNINDVYRINLLTLAWEKISSPGLPISYRDKSVAWSWDNRIFCFGGYGASPKDCLWDSNDIFTMELDRGWNDQLVCFDCQTDEWSRPNCKGTKPLPRAAHAAACIGDVAYIFGGRYCRERMNDLHCFRMDTMTWSGSVLCNGELPCGRSWHSLTKFSKTQLLLYGGFSTAETPLDDAWVLDVNTFSWSLLEKSTGFPRLWHTACSNMMGDVLIFGGCVSNILSHGEVMITSDQVLFFKNQPFKLVRSCLHVLHKHRDKTQPQWRSLPRLFSEWLELKSALVDGTDGFYPSLNWKNTHRIFGPSLNQLSHVIQT